MVAPPPNVLVGASASYEVPAPGVGVRVGVLVGPIGVLVGVGVAVGGTGVLVGVFVGPTGVFVGVFVGPTGVFVGVLVGGSEVLVGVLVGPGVGVGPAPPSMLIVSISNTAYVASLWTRRRYCVFATFA